VAESGRSGEAPSNPCQNSQVIEVKFASQMDDFVDVTWQMHPAAHEFANSINDIVIKDTQATPFLTCRQPKGIEQVAVCTILSASESPGHFPMMWQSWCWKRWCTAARTCAARR
jgi:hypothetical protein